MALLSALISVRVTETVSKQQFQKWPRTILLLVKKQCHLWKKFRNNHTPANYNKWKAVAKKARNVKHGEILRYEQQLIDKKH